MNCPNCGVRVTGLYCDHCKSFIKSKETDSKVLKKTENEVNSLLERLDFFKNPKNNIPEEKRNKTIQVLEGKLNSLTKE